MSGGLKKGNMETIIDFPQYHHDNPGVYEAFKKYTFEAIGKGFKHISSDFILHIVRWHTPVTGDDDFKINNNYTPFYARLFMNEHPQYEGLFRLRKSKYDL
jgi:hypothetical protein